MKITIAILILIVGILLNVVYLQNEKIEVHEKIQDIDSRCIIKQDSIIRVLTEKESERR